MSRNDMEVYMLNDAQKIFVPVLKNLLDPTEVVLEFHGNHGPCDGCKERLTKAISYFSSLLPKGSTLVSRVIYSEEAHGKLRGNQVPILTTYGYSEGTVRYTYGSDDMPVYAKEWTKTITD